MKTVGKFIVSTLLVLIVCVLLYLNTAVYYRPELKAVGNDTINYDLLQQLRYLKRAIASGEAEAMQKIYPEGYIFMHSLYGLAWCDLSGDVEHSSALYKEAHDEIEKSYTAVASDEAKSTFDESLALPYGAFYRGWSNFLLGKKLRIESSTERNVEQVNLFKEQCSEIARAIHSGKSPYPESYYRAAWPADVVLCMASLQLHDHLYTPLYKTTLDAWLKQVQATLDSNGLIPHAVDAATGLPREEARGSSQSLMLIFMREINPAFGQQQFNLYKKHFLESRLGLPGIREYYNGTAGSGDIDSGPVIFGMGAAASIVGLRALATYDDSSNAYALQCGIEAFGIAIKNNNEKKYFFGAMPMADAFIAWSHAGLSSKSNASTDASWRNHFHLYSLLITGIALLLWMLIWGYIKPFRR